LGCLFLAQSRKGAVGFLFLQEGSFLSFETRKSQSAACVDNPAQTLPLIPMKGCQ